MSDTGPTAPVRDTSAVGKNLSLVRLHIAAQKQTVSRVALSCRNKSLILPFPKRCRARSRRSKAQATKLR